MSVSLKELLGVALGITTVGHGLRVFGRHMNASVFLVQNAEDIIIAVVGGAGKHSAYIPTFGARKASRAPWPGATGSLRGRPRSFAPVEIAPGATMAAGRREGI
jgi:hypothetical protein